MKGKQKKVGKPIFKHEKIIIGFEAGIIFCQSFSLLQSTIVDRTSKWISGEIQNSVQLVSSFNSNV